MVCCECIVSGWTPPSSCQSACVVSGKVADWLPSCHCTLLQMCHSRRSCWILTTLYHYCSRWLPEGVRWGGGWPVAGGPRWPPYSPSPLLTWSKWRQRWWALQQSRPCTCSGVEEGIKRGNLRRTLLKRISLFWWCCSTVKCTTMFVYAPATRPSYAQDHHSSIPAPVVCCGHDMHAGFVHVMYHCIIYDW